MKLTRQEARPSGVTRPGSVDHDVRAINADRDREVAAYADNWHRRVVNVGTQYCLRMQSHRIELPILGRFNGPLRDKLTHFVSTAEAAK